MYQSSYDFDNVDYCSIYAYSPYINETASLAKIDNSIVTKIFNYIKSIESSKINILNINLYEYIPSHLLDEYADYHNKVCEFVINNYQKPDDYDILKSLLKCLYKISTKSINLSNDEMVEKYGNKILLHPFTKTGRLGTCHKTFPILSLKKEDRKYILPKNDYFLELDHNGAEIRTLLYLCDIEQPDGDVYEYINKECYKNSMTRDEIKKNIITTMYSGNENIGNLSKIFNIKNLKEKYYIDGNVVTPFGKKIKSDDFHFLNYLCQSTFSYLFYFQMMKMQEFLSGKKSYVSFPLHDSLIIDLSESDLEIAKDIVSIYKNTIFGNFLVNKKLGLNYLDMVKL